MVPHLRPIAALSCQDVQQHWNHFPHQQHIHLAVAWQLKRRWKRSVSTLCGIRRVVETKEQHFNDYEDDLEHKFKRALETQRWC